MSEAQMKKYMIEISNMTKSFGENTAVDRLTLNVAQGEFFCFLGPNGAGKTTTIKVLTGLLYPTSGEVKIDGLDIKKEHVSVKKIMSYIPDFPYIFEKLTGREFLEFVARMYDVPPELSEERIQEYLKMFSLTDRADHLMEDYSHGMRQKIVISAAMIHDPKLIIVDEPMVGLDPKGIRQVKDLFKQKTKEGGCVFMSTHILSMAEELADRIGIIHQGRLVALGTRDEILARAEHKKDFEEIFMALSDETES